MYKVTRALSALTECNRAVVRASDEATLLAEVCRIIVETAGYRMAWVGYAEADQQKTVRPVGHAGFEDGYVETVNVTWADVPRGRGPAGTAVRTGKRSIIQDIPSDPRFAPWREQAVRRGYASAVGLPLRDGERTFGVVTIYAPEANAFGDKEVDLLTELADNLAYGIISLRTRIAHQQAQRDLERSNAELEQRVAERTAELARTGARLTEGEARYHILFEDSPLSLWEEDFSQVKRYLDGVRDSGARDVRKFFLEHPEEAVRCADLVRILDVNKATLKLLEAENKEQLLGRLGDCFTGWAMDVFREELIALAEGKRQFEAESSHRTLSGKTIHIALYVGVVPGCEQTLSKVLVSMLDITAHKLAQERVKREQQMLRQMLDVYEKHRQLIAYEIHDGVIQLMTGALMNLEGTMQRLRSEPAAAICEDLRKVAQLLRDGLAEARRLMGGLRPVVLDEAGLLPALEFLVAEARQAGTEEILYSADVQFERLALPLETAVFRIVQEGLNNARRHSRSEKIRVSLTQTGDRLRVEIEDWGRGFDPEKVARDRFGLQGIAQRAEVFGGRYEVRSLPGRGTCIAVDLPLVEAAPEE